MKIGIIKGIVIVGVCACIEMTRAEGIAYSGDQLLKLEPRTEEEARELQRRAEAGEAEAQHELSICYGRGFGVRQDYTEAFKWAMASAKQGYAPAESTVGGCYLRGTGVEMNTEEALKWLKSAADKGNKDAYWSLASLYLSGAHGVKPNHEKGAECLQRAAEAGHVQAARMTGIIYLKGVGVPRNIRLARQWLMKAAAQNDIAAKFLLSSISEDPEELEETIKWMKDIAEQGSSEAAQFLGNLYMSGELVPRDMEQARIWHEKGAELGNNASQTKLGYILQYGIGVKPDKERARKMYEAAMAQDNIEATISLGKMYYDGDGVPRDKQKGMELTRKAAETANNVKAQFNMGIMTSENWDFVQARKWFQLAAEQGHMASLIILGELYRRGLGGEQDLQKARECKEEAAAKGVDYSVMGIGVGNLETVLDAAEAANAK